MKKYYLNIVTIATCLFFSSCEQEYLIDTSDFEKQLVVNSLFTHDEPWRISVTNSVNILDHEDIGPVLDAKVEIYDQNGKYIYDLFLDENGLYSNGEIAPSYGRGYSVTVRAPGYKSVYANDRVPKEGELSISKRDIYGKSGEIVDTEITFSVGTTDEESFLVWELYDADEIGESGIPESERNLTNTWLKQLTFNPKSVINKGSAKVSKTLNGNVTTTLGALIDIDLGGRDSEDIAEGGGGSPDKSNKINELGYENLIVHGNIGQGGSGDEDDETEDESYQYELRVMTISKDLHTYFKSVKDYYRFNPNSTLIPPTKVHSNVSNGLGVFAGYHELVEQF